MLQAQINPHFLFNILNSIRLKILLKEDEENAALIQSLSSLLRMTINRNNEFIPLYQEVDIVINYIKLMNMRQQTPIKYEVNLPDNTRMKEVPRLFIQPFIENTYIHGFHQGGGKIVISASLLHDILMVTVEDDGNGMTEQQSRDLLQHLETDSEAMSDKASGFSGIGLKNVYERMKLIHGQAFRMEIDSTPGSGTKITLLIPME
jgi:two-component system sensor histidine kinase YesM